LSGPSHLGSLVGLSITRQPSGEKNMSNQQKTNKEAKKKSNLTPKEQKIAKILKKEAQKSRGLGL